MDSITLKLVQSFTLSLFTSQIKENRPPGTLVGRVIAHDNDIGANGQVEFSLSSQNGRYQHLFSINEKGEIWSTEMLDRESNQHGFLFTVSHVVFEFGFYK